MRKTYKRMAIVGIVVALVVLISFPTNAITAGTSFKKLTSKKNLSDVVSNVANNVRHGLEKIKNRVVNRMNGGDRELNSGKGVHVCKIQARKTMAASNLLGKPLFYPMCTLGNGDELSINITDVGAEPQYADYNKSVNITCVVTSDLTVDIVNVTISGPSGFYINRSMNNSSDTKYYYNASYNINGTYNYYIWAKNESTGNQSISDIYFFYVGNWPPQITNVEHIVNGNFVNILCNVTDNDHNDTDNVSTVKVIFSGNTSGNKEFPMTNINGTDTYYNNESYVNDTYTYYIWANDTAGNENTSGMGNFKIGKKVVTETKHVQVTNYIENESHPSMVPFGNEKYFLAYEKSNAILDSVMCDDEILFTSSTDNGENWIEGVGFGLGGNQTSPDISIMPNNRIFGTFHSEDYIVSYFDLMDPSDTNTWDLFSFTGLIVKNTSEFVISTQYTDKKIIAFAGDYYSDGEWYEDIPMYLYNDTNYPDPYWADEWAMVTFEESDLPDDISSFTRPTVTMDGNTGITIAYEVINEDTGKKEIFTLVNPTGDALSEDEVWNSVLLSNEKNLTSPASATKNQNIYVSVESEYDGNYDVIVYTSSNGGLNWTENDIAANTATSERYPAVYANNTHLFCAYYESGDLYLVSSTDDGVSWSEPEKINDEDGKVMEDYHTADIADSTHIAWTDKRNETETGYDIWCAILGVEKEEEEPESDLFIESIELSKNCEEIEALNVITLTIRNKGKGAANHVRYWVNCTCLTDEGSEIKEIVSKDPQHYIKKTIPALSTVTIKLTWFEVQSPLERIFHYLLDKDLPPFMKYEGIDKIQAHIGPTDESDTSYDYEKSVSWDEIFAYLLKIIPEPKIVKSEKNFIVTVTKNGTASAGALIFYGPAPQGQQILFSIIKRIIKKIPIRLLPFKLRTKIVLFLLKSSLLSACTILKHVTATSTDPDGKAQLTAPPVLFRSEREMPLLAISNDLTSVGFTTVTVQKS
ncbi:hypothetical protein MBGDN05_00342 [Thermoplasmatales archaeon SCGC AB-539-N05]|nr:hypothetical protein MBGDN05_00342 [Thermoplasmatales archaeon SCGC AB-539-N05]